MSFRPLSAALLLAITPLASAVDVVKGDDFSVVLGGNLQFDLGHASDVGTATTGDGLWRRQRLSLEVGLGENVSLNAEYDGKAADWTDLYAGITGIGPGELMIGQFKQFFSLDQLTSSKRVLFVERSMSDGAFAIARRMGVGYQVVKPNYGIAGSAFGRARNDAPSTSGVSLRGWLSPDNETGNVSHYGVAVTRESPDNDRIGFSARPGTRFTTLRAARTPSLSDSDGLTRFGVEYGMVRGPWFVQAEAMAVQVDRTGGDFTGTTAYVQMSYSFFGASRAYKEGVFRSPQGVDHPLEIGARIDHLDLNDDRVRGGSALGVGVVASYWVGKDTRVMLDANRYNRAPGDLDPQSVNLRLQWAF